MFSQYLSLDKDSKSYCLKTIPKPKVPAPLAPAFFKNPVHQISTMTAINTARETKRKLRKTFTVS